MAKLSVADVVPSDSSHPTIPGVAWINCLAGGLQHLEVTITTATIGGSYSFRFLSGPSEFGPAPGLAVSRGASRSPEPWHSRSRASNGVSDLVERFASGGLNERGLSPSELSGVCSGEWV